MPVIALRGRASCGAMLNRRDFPTLTGLAAMAARTSRAHAANRHWPRYRETLVIDGEAASGFYFLEDSDPKMKSELEAIRASGLGGVLLSVAPGGRFWLDDAAFEAAKSSTNTCRARIVTYSDYVMLVQDASDLQLALRQKRMGVIMRFQGSEPLGEDPARIPLFRELGVRVIQLTHNRRNLVGDGATEPGNAGLSRYGREVVERLNAEKVVVDLAHGSQRTIAEGIAASKAPVLISHTGCRALADLPRNTGDAELRAMAERGGVAGIIFWPYLRTDTQPMAIDVIRHIEHAIQICGEDHVGIGTDNYIAPIERSASFEKDNREAIKAIVEAGIFEKGRPADLYTFIPDLNVADKYDLLAALLAARGHSDTRIAKILGGNFARVLGEVWS